MAEKKLKMSNKRFMIILIPILVFLVALIIVVTAVMNYFSLTMDTYLGRGDRVVSNPEGTENWDLDYYGQKYTDTAGEGGSLLAAAKVSKTASDEGTVLLKNTGKVLPLAKGTKVTPFGCRYATPVYGGTGSGNVNVDSDYVWTAKEGLAKYFDVNETVAAIHDDATIMELTSESLTESEVNNSGTTFSGASTSIFEYASGTYDSAKESCSDTVGIVYIGRIGGEGGNLSTEEYYDGTAHNLALSNLEKETIKFAKENCSKTVAVVNTSNVMELGPIMDGEYECDAIIWIGGPGATGFESLADIMVGNINPSGRTVDVWETDVMRNPTMANWGDRTYTNTQDDALWGSGGQAIVGFYFYEYEEGIYYGYRYYETASDMGKLTYGELDAEGGVATAGEVCYPFGYGLSYTTFDQEIVNVSTSGDDVSVTVKVSNTGGVDGKEVVQLYYTAPYTDLDETMKIEKSTKVLAAFDKVEVKANDSVEVTLAFPKEEMASYCYTRENPDGTEGCYMLEEGEYKITLGKNSHSAFDEETINIPSTIWYDNDNPRQSEINAQSQWNDEGEPLGFPAKAAEDKDAEFMAATNRFPDMNEYMQTEATILTRSNWDATQPAAPEAKALSDERYAKLNFDPETDEIMGNGKDSKIYNETTPTSNADNGLKLVDMRGLDYYSEVWDDFLDQIDYDNSQLLQMILKSAYGTGALDEVGKPQTSDSDGPQGFGKTGVGGGYESCAYVSETVVGSTWNVDIAYAYGEAIAQEALVLGIQGWYGPALNIHRSAFCGRNFEYYSEDPVLSGKIGAACISGAEQNGLVTYTKHFAMNDYEGVNVSMAAWITEQAYRETDLRSFEIAVKEAKKTIKYIADENGTVKEKTIRGATGMMGACTYMGMEWQAASYALLTEVLRGEWGFQGLVSTDMCLETFSGVSDKLLRAGSDMKMYFMFQNNLIDSSSSTFLNVVRRSVKNICYAYANSNATQGAAPGAIISYTMSPWAIGLLIANIVIYAFVLFMAVYTVIRVLDSRKHPEKYNNSSEKV